MTSDELLTASEDAPVRTPRAKTRGRDRDDANRKALAVLMQATRAVAGEIGGAQTALQALLSHQRADVASVAAEFDALPGWQRAKIAELAQAAVMAARR